jgi:peptidoglycan/LPS O-acetylase OafA/YrhL
MALTGPNQKITFANQLRGVAVLCVLLSHYLGTYWGDRADIAQHILAPLPEGNPLPLFYWISFFPTLNYGPLGVGIFFLISGFVIPFSLEKMGSARFVAARLMRIYPTYWVGLTVTLLALWLSAHYWGQAMHLDHRTWVANMLLVHMQLALPTLDNVNWTLAVETKFYAAMLLLWPLVKRAPVATITGFAVIVLAVLSWIPASWHVIAIGGTAVGIDMTKVELMFLPFLFIGTLFHFAFRGRITTALLAGATLVVLAAFAMMWEKTVLAGQVWATPLNYLYALVVFSTAYGLRNRFRPLRLFDFFADISYPLYIVHCMMGYALIRFLMANGWGNAAAIAVAFAVSVAVAWLLHVAIEMPTAHFGKRLGAAQSG